MTSPIITDDVIGTTTRVLVQAIRKSLVDKGECRLAISGGSTPGPVFERLVDELSPEEVGQILLTWADERVLPVQETHPWMAGYDEQANIRLAWDRWLSKLDVLPKIVLPLSTGTDMGSDIRRVNSIMFQDFRRGLDVAFLGMGPDGHTASLFPDHSGLKARGGAVAVQHSPKPPPNRISLTLDLLCRTDHVLFAITGESKAAAVADLLSNEPRFPAGQVRPRVERTIVLDRAAAGQLEQR